MDQQIEKKIRVGIIGSGNWANFGHIPALQLLSEYEVTVVQSRRKEAAITTAAKFGIKNVVDRPEDVINHPEVDLVVLLTIAPFHAEGIRLAVAAKKDIYSEWPFTVNTTVARQLKELVDNANLRHIIGLQRRLSPTNRYLKELIKEGYIGKLRSVRLHVSMNYFQALRESYLRWTIPPENFCSVVSIYAGHFLDALFGVVGNPINISALTINQFPIVTDMETKEEFQTTNPDQLVMTGVLPGNAVLTVHIEGGKRNGSGVQIDLTGDEGDLKITNVSAFGGVGEDYVIMGAHGNNAPLQQLEVPPGFSWIPPSELPSAAQELAHLYAAFANDKKNGTHFATTFNDALWMHQFLDAIDQSSQTGKRVSIDVND